MKRRTWRVLILRHEYIKDWLKIHKVHFIWFAFARYFRFRNPLDRWREIPLISASLLDDFLQPKRLLFCKCLGLKLQSLVKAHIAYSTTTVNHTSKPQFSTSREDWVINKSTFACYSHSQLRPFNASHQNLLRSPSRTSILRLNIEQAHHYGMLSALLNSAWETLRVSSVWPDEIIDQSFKSIRGWNNLSWKLFSRVRIAQGCSIIRSVSGDGT